MEMLNSHCEHEHSMKQIRRLLCMCESGVACCQSQHQCHFWRLANYYKLFSGLIGFARRPAEKFIDILKTKGQ